MLPTQQSTLTFIASEARNTAQHSAKFCEYNVTMIDSNGSMKMIFSMPVLDLAEDQMKISKYVAVMAKRRALAGIVVV